MRFFTFEIEDKIRVGVEDKGQLFDLSAAHKALLASQETKAPWPPADMLTFIRAGSAAIDAAREALNSTKTSRYSFGDVRILAPIPRPGKILCAGVNYRGHLEENPEATLPESPFFFSKLPSVVIGPGHPIIHPKLTRQLDYEVELAVVIGRTMRNISEDQIMDYIFGFTILHDVSARDIQFKDNQITLGKNFDTFAPLGPCIVTKEELPYLDNLRLRTLLNGRMMQDGSTQDWVFPLPHLLASLARVMTLEPGDVVSTGTPAGVGVFRHPQVFLRPGDTVVIEVEGIGQLENPVIAET